VAELRSNAGVLILPSLILIATAAATSYFAFQLPEEWQRLAVGIGGIVIVLVGFVVPLWVWLSRRYTITTRRTVMRDGLVVRNRREVLHARIVEIGVRRSPWQVLAGSGDVILELGSGRTAVLKGVRSPLLVQAALTDLAEVQRAVAPSRRAQTGDVGVER